MLLKIEKLWSYKEQLQCKTNLIHCITNPISMNDCANAVLCLGAKVIMAQHPKECEEITKQSDALALNLGNFDDTRAISMKLSAGIANQNSIPMILDVVGVGCSALRKQYAITFLEEQQPNIIKGNASELKALISNTSNAIGIDVGIQDMEEPNQRAHWLKEVAQRFQCIVVCSGKVDVITDGKQTVFVHNGCSLLSTITGTGCMLNVLCASFMSVCSPFESAVLACAYLGIAAELSYQETSVPGTFHRKLFDHLYAMTKQSFKARIHIEQDSGHHEGK